MPDLTYTYTFTFYDGAEKVQTVSQGVSTFTVTDGIGTFEDGKVIYKDVTVKCITASGVFIRSPPWPTRRNWGISMSPKGAVPFTPYSTARASTFARRMQASPVHFRTSRLRGIGRWEAVCLRSTACRCPTTRPITIIMQGSTKYDLQTFYFDVVTGRGGELAVDLLVTGSQSSADPDRYAVLSGQKILKNKTLSAQTYLQTFDINGKVYVDLQSLLPGASLMVSVGDGFLILANDSQSNVYKNGYLYADISSFYEATWAGDGYFTDIDGKTIYDTNTKEVFDLPEGAVLQGVYGGKVYYITEEEQSDGSASKYFLYVYVLSGRQAVRIGHPGGIRVEGYNSLCPDGGRRFLRSFRYFR